MTLTHKVGSLFDSTAEAYAQGVNTEGLMGAGIAVLFKKEDPDMYRAYKVACKAGEIKPGMLWVWDRWPAASIQGCCRRPQSKAVLEASRPSRRWTYNIASQDKPGPNARLEWFERGLTYSILHAEEFGVKSIAMPRIGCGIGGLEWDDVLDIIEHYADKSTIDIEVWSKE